MAITDKAHALIKDHLRNHFNGADMQLAIDATCGNGHDTLFLLELGFKKVLAFDIQQSALDATKQKLNEHKHKQQKSSYQLILDGHENMSGYIEQAVDCIMFNFGYLPTADKNLTTQAHTSLKAIQAAMNALSEDGLITLLCYPGHPAGKIETDQITAFLESVDSNWKTTTHLASAPKPTAPILFTINKNNIKN